MRIPAWNLRFTVLLVLILGAGLPGLDPGDARAADALEKGVEWYRKRARTVQGLTADPTAVNRAIEHLKQALENPENEETAGVYLLMAYNFKGAHTGRSNREQQVIYAKGKRLGARMVERHPKSAPLAFWYAVNLGRWAEVYGVFAAAREGVAGTLRSLCKNVIKLDPDYRGGGGYWMLGQVHYKTPYIPFVITWPSHEKALELFRKALRIDPRHLMTNYYYARVLYDEGQTRQALSIMGRVSRAEPAEETLLRDKSVIARARTFLEERR